MRLTLSPASAPTATFVATLIAMLAVSGCASRPEPPKPVPRPVVVPRPAPPVVAVPQATDWRDWPVTPGDWRYAQRPGSSSASFENAGRSRLSLTCDPAMRQVRLAGMAEGAVTVRTTSLARTLATVLVPGNPPYSALTLDARDPLLDAMAFSRGRVIIEQAGQAPLVLPAWAEIGRVIEDCRR